MQIRGKIILMLLAAGLLAGCATRRNIWAKTGVSSIQAEKDLRFCANTGWFLYDPKGNDGKPIAINSQRTYYWAGAQIPFEKCMTGKGYQITKTK